MTSHTSFINAIALGPYRHGAHSLHLHTGDTLRSFSLVEIDDRANLMARRLRAMGIRKGDRVGIVSENCVEWVVLDLAIMKAGGVTAGFEPGRFDPHELVKTYGLKLLFGQHLPPDKGMLDIALAWRWSHGHGVPRDTSALHRGYDPADILAIRLTSGSTGQPKALEVTAGSVDASLTAVQQMFDHGPGDNILVFLPLGCSIQQRYWVYSAFATGHDVAVSNFANFQATAREVSPTVVMGVPGFYEQIKARIEQQIPDIKDLQNLETRRRAIQAALGGRVRYLWTGSAPASRALLHFFNDCGVPLFEGYGLSETCIVAKNHPGAFKLGSVGKVLPGKTIRFDQDGVLIVGSRFPVNSRYSWCRPGESEKIFLPTAEVRTNDVGRIDEDGFLYILGRVDDIVVLSNGLNVLVRDIEDAVRTHPDVHECFLYGHGKAFLTAIISPATDMPGVASIKAHLNAWNLSCRPEQRIGAMVLLAEALSINSGMLTSQLKPVRKAIHLHVGYHLQAAYESTEARHPLDILVVVQGGGMQAGNARLMGLQVRAAPVPGMQPVTEEA
ncbi:MAG: AMP-binding protein [Bdellovibrionales bacterium]|nr:AMP-binding protein [Ramlibacter sp.]